ncbi:ribonuclease III [Vineibacter terrae]|uniref:ribonuclease III n=1 Tax=Vineibacter terrae TaxID=2586908 RepID=UPI001E545AB7|nr:ribonuclease III [Vineibacter terrae]
MDAVPAVVDREQAFAAALGHDFANRELLREALTHRSAIDRQRGRNLDLQHGNERLEFLGDRVLSLAVADVLIRRFPLESEGELARRHAALVRAETLVEVARVIGLGAHLLLADSEEATGGREKPAILADACEAVIGAVYRDGGLEAARSFVERYWVPRIEHDPKPPRDPKTALQEWAQGRGLPLPSYREVGRDGPPHAPQFIMEVMVRGRTPAHGSGKTKREAERAAATAMLDALK